MISSCMSNVGIPTLALWLNFSKGLYSKTLGKIEITDAEDACVNLNKLIIIDGMDEVNDKSRALVNQLISLYGRQTEFSTFVVSCRPHAVSTVSGHCSRNNIPFYTCKILTIEELDHQIDFLNKYKRTVPATVEGNVLAAFKNLNEEVRKHFITPIHLALFCDAFLPFQWQHYQLDQRMRCYEGNFQALQKQKWLKDLTNKVWMTLTLSHEL